MYSTKAHPEPMGNGIYIAYNVNSFDFMELVDNKTIYFAKFIKLTISKK